MIEKKNKCHIKKKMPQEKINKFVAENGTRRLIVGWRMKKVEKFGDKSRKSLCSYVMY